MSPPPATSSPAAEGQVPGGSTASQVWRSRCGCVRTVLMRADEDGSSRMAAAHWFHRTGGGALTPQGEHVLIFKLRGSASVEARIDGRSRVKRPLNGSFSMVPEGRDTFWAVRGDHETIHLYLPDHVVRDFVERHPAYHGRSLVPVFAVEDPWLTAYLQMFLAEAPTLEASEPASLFLSESRHLLLRHLLARHAGSTAAAGVGAGGRRVSPLRPFLMRRIVDYVDAHLAGEITLTQLAEQVHMSPDHFLRAFSAAAGTTPYRYVQEQRVGRAAQLLAGTMLDVQDVARRCGYRSPSHFSQQFRRRYGVTPQAYRQRAAAGT